MKMNVNPTSRSLGATQSPKPFSTHLLTLPKHLIMLILMTLTTTHAWAIYGEGLPTNPYQIYSAADLHKFRDIVNGTNGETQNAGAWAKLYKDIDNLGDWTPIGTSTTPYTGTFEGNNHKINGMSILNYTTSFQGLFGCIEDATVCNLSLSGSMTSAQMLSNNSDYTNGSATVVGSALGQSLVKNISSSVDWTISNTTQTHLGGIVGCLSGTTSVRDCTYSGTMNAGQSKDCLGGIVGYAKPSCVTSIINCFFCGKISTSPATDVAPPVLGGILGYISDGSGVFGGVKGCYSCGTLNAGEAQTTYVSAIIGWARSKSIHGNNVRDNYYLSGTALRAIVAESTSPFDATTNKAITISVKANDESYGSVSHRYVNPTSTSATKLEVSATPSSLGVFGSWSDGGSQTHQVALNADISLTATFTPKPAKAVLSGNTLTFYCDDITHEGTTYSLPAANSTSYPGWYEKRSDITTVVFDESFRDYRPVNCNYWFIDFSYLTSIKGMENLNTSEVTQMRFMFAYCIKLSSLTIYNFDMSKVTDATKMFDNCHNLNTLTLKSIPYLKDGTFNSWFEGKTVNCELDANSTIYEGTNYLPTITNCNHYFNTEVAVSREATCTDFGYTKAHQCKMCNELGNYEGITPALGHNTSDDDGYCTGCHQVLPVAITTAPDGYYEIYNLGELLWYLNNLNIYGEIESNGRLMKDIVINDGTFAADGTYTAGTSNRALVDGFMTGHKLRSATFDGNNHAIVGLYGSVSGNCGLFAQIGYYTVI